NSAIAAGKEVMRHFDDNPFWRARVDVIHGFNFGSKWLGASELFWKELNVKPSLPTKVQDPPAAQFKLDPILRQKRQFDQLADYIQKLLSASKQRREEFFWSKLDTSSVEKFQKSQEPLRDYFWKEIIGKLPEPNVPINPRTRLLYQTPKWKAYEVVLDV